MTNDTSSSTPVNSEPNASGASTTSWPAVFSVVFLSVLAALPALVLEYLPMTDLPAHLAVLSAVSHFNDPTWHFDRYFAVDFGNTLYLLPYVIAWLIEPVAGLEAGYRIAVFLSLVSVPVGLLVVLLAAEKSPWLALLGLAVMYNRAFFWGFVNFNLALGLSLFAVGLLRWNTKSWFKPAGLFLLSGLLVICHVYGIAMVAGIAILALFLCPATRSWRNFLPAFGPLVAGSFVWWVKGRDQPGFGEWVWPGFFERITTVDESILGGWQDNTELALLVIVVLVCVPFVIRSLSEVAHEADSQTLRWNWVFALFVAGNILLYLVLPANTKTAKFIHFRHAVIAITFLPLVCDLCGRRARLGKVGCATVALFATANTWAHLLLFDREASSFNAIRNAIHGPARIAGLIYEPMGKISKTLPYLHFPAYLHADVGGFVSASFAKFWNVPLKYREDVPLPPWHHSLEWYPHKFLESEPQFYDYVVVRLDENLLFHTTSEFPFEPILVAGEWKLYRKIEVDAQKL